MFFLPQAGFRTPSGAKRYPAYPSLVLNPSVCTPEFFVWFHMSTNWTFSKRKRHAAPPRKRSQKRGLFPTVVWTWFVIPLYLQSTFYHHVHHNSCKKKKGEPPLSHPGVFSGLIKLINHHVHYPLTLIGLKIRAWNHQGGDDRITLTNQQKSPLCP